MADDTYLRICRTLFLHRTTCYSVQAKRCGADIFLKMENVFKCHCLQYLPSSISLSFPILILFVSNMICIIFGQIVVCQFFNSKTNFQFSFLTITQFIQDTFCARCTITSFIQDTLCAHCTFLRPEVTAIMGSSII